ncbi:heparan sulfate glucosamine 3-O-sulfotransferase 6-like [Styela clava]
MNFIRLSVLLIILCSMLMYFIFYLFISNHNIGARKTQDRDIEAGITIDDRLHIRIAEWNHYLKLSQSTKKTKRLPNIIGIGVKKCGTEAMITFIRQHPFIKTPNYKETFFFNEKYDKGLDYYKSQMPEVTDGELIMEKTPPYFNSPPESLPEIINKDVPNAKLILVLCDPVKRSYSDFIHEKIKPPNLSTVTQYNSFDDYLDVYIDRVKTSLDKNNNITLKNVMSSNKNDYATTLLTTGLYSIHLPRWINTFNSSNLLILNGEKMIEDPGHQVGRMQDFLGIPRLLQPGDFVRNSRNGLYCIRPWWNGYDFKAEFNNSPDWEKNLICLSETKKGRTRHKNGRVNATKKHIIELKNLYRSYNKELYKMLEINFEWL